MNKPNQPVLSTGRLILSLFAAMIAGVGLTIVVILPAEKGTDPTGFGAASGLDKLANQNETLLKVEDQPVVSNSDALYIAIDPETTKPKVDEFGDALPVVDGVNLRAHKTVFNSETIEILIDTDAQVEYKAIMDRGEVLLYAWQADGELYYDFHAHQAEGNRDFFTRYAEGEGNSDQGSIVAPYQGQHGWFWLNIEGKPITVKLTVAGYYDEIKKIDLSEEEQQTE